MAENEILLSSQTEHEYIKEKNILKVGYITDLAPFQYEGE